MRSRTRAKNEVHAVLQRNLKGRPPASDAFGKRGRRWLGSLELADDERATVDGCLREIDFLSEEIAAIERRLAELALDSAELRRLMSVPGVSLVSALTFLAVVGDIAASRRPSGSSPTSGSIPRCASRARRRRVMAGSPSRIWGGPAHALRGGLDRGQDARPAARLLRAAAGATGSRKRRHRPQALRALLRSCSFASRTTPSSGPR